MPAQPPSTLSADALLTLQALGQAVRSAGSPVERGLAIDRAVATCRSHRDAGIPWETMRRALAVSATTLRRWRRRATVAKPGQPPSHRSPVLDELVRSTRASILALPRSDGTAGSGSMPSYDSADLAFSGSSWSSEAARSTPASLPPHREERERLARPAVLVLTGDPRRGGNVFDVEVSAIRRSLLPGLVTSRHLAMVELGEIASAIDRERPLVLHLCAHNGPGGVALSRHDRAHLVDPVEVAEAVERADHRPTCLVLGFCRSDLVAPQIARTIPAVISWPGEVTDHQGALFADELYRHLATRNTLRRAFQEAAANVTSQDAGTIVPVLRSRWHGPLF